MKSAIMKATGERYNARRKADSVAMKLSPMKAPTAVQSPKVDAATMLCHDGLRPSEKREGY
jgi:hypothetical protein